MKLNIQFPTRGRPDKFFEVLDIYKNTAEDWDSIDVYAICNEDDGSMNNRKTGERFMSYKNCFPIFGKINSKIEACNYKAGGREWDIILLASDDMIPVKEGWDTIIKEDMQREFPDTDGVLWYNDGHKGDKLCTLSVLGRKYFNRFGYIYNPEYKSFFCDNEFGEVAKELGRLFYNPLCIIEHRHPDYHLTKTDALYKFNLRYHGHDKAVFNRRRQNGFKE